MCPISTDALQLEMHLQGFVPFKKLCIDWKVTAGVQCQLKIETKYNIAWLCSLYGAHTRYSRNNDVYFHPVAHLLKNRSSGKRNECAWCGWMLIHVGDLHIHHPPSMLTGESDTYKLWTAPFTYKMNQKWTQANWLGKVYIIYTDAAGNGASLLASA